MKIRRIALLTLVFSINNIANAAEIYNQDGNKLNLYGKIDVRNHIGKGKSGGDDSRVRVGIKGSTEISANLTGFGQFEWETMTNKTEDNHIDKNRLAYVGINHKYLGSIDYGLNYGVLYHIDGWIDVLPMFWDDGISMADNYMNGRNRNLLTYRNNNFFGYIDGLNIALQYQGKNTTNNKSGVSAAKQNNGDGYGLSVIYNTDFGLSFGGSYSNSHNVNNDMANYYANGKRAEAWSIGTKYNANNVYLASTYIETRNMTPFGSTNTNIAPKTQTFEIVAQYTFDYGLKPSLAYIQAKGKDLGEYGDNYLNKFISLGSFYYFNKNFAALLDYKINLLDKNKFTENYGISTDNVLGLGLVYYF